MQAGDLGSRPGHHGIAGRTLLRADFMDKETAADEDQTGAETSSVAKTKVKHKQSSTEITIRR